MHPAEPHYIAARIDSITCHEPVVELGAGWDLEFHWKPFRDAGFNQFYTQDIVQHPGRALDFRGDICQGTNIPDAFAGTVLIFSVLEHTYAPWQAVDEIYRILKPGGVVMGGIPLRTNIHRHDRDCWRVMPDGLAYLLRTLRLEHFAMDGNVALPANIMFAAVKDPEMSDWWDHNQNVVLNPEVILGRDYTLAPGWKRKVQDMLRRRTGLSLEKWDGPWNEPRMRELGFESWTSRSYP